MQSEHLFQLVHNMEMLTILSLLTLEGQLVFLTSYCFLIFGPFFFFNLFNYEFIITALSLQELQVGLA